jgi:hypothetical protein
LDGFADVDFADTEPFGEICNTGFASFVNEGGDEFDVIFSDLSAVIEPGSVESFGVGDGAILAGRVAGCFGFSRGFARFFG